MRGRVDMTKDELIDELMKLEENETEHLYKYVSLLEKIYAKIKYSRDEEDQREKEYYKRKLIEKRIYYGTFMKTSKKKDEKVASDNLKKAIKLDRILPIAYYRLGFLAYGQQDYAEAFQYFNQAIEFQNGGRSHPKYLMNEQQYYFAHLYLCNSALYVAEMMQQQVENLSEREGLKKRLQNVELSPFYEQIRRNEEQIYQAAYTVVTNDGQYTCSKDEANDEADELVDQAVVLMFSRGENVVRYKGKIEVLTLENAEMLRYFFLNTSEEKPAVRDEFEAVIARSIVTERVSKDAYRQRVSRLNRTLRELGIAERLIAGKQMYDRAYRDELAEEDRETGYYYNGFIPFAVIYQTSDVFLLDEER